LTLLPELPGAVSDADAAALDQALADAVTLAGLHGGAAAIITPKGAWTGAAGVTGPSDRKATAKDMYSIASVTKLFTATLVMHLVEDGKMALDQPLSTYLKGTAPTNGATVRQALQMRGGIAETAQETRNQVYADCTRVWTRDDIYAQVPAPVGKPDSGYLYSNPTYKMLGFAAEDVIGQPLSTALPAAIITPASLDRIVFQDGTARTPEPWALPLDGSSGELPVGEFGKGGTLPCLADSTFSAGGTAMASDAASLAAWGWRLFEGKVIKPETLQSMLVIGPEDYGYGIERTADFGAGPSYGHTGTKPGYGALLAILPEAKTVVVVLVNDGDADTDGIARRLLNAS
jgi:D-alanyl-D-alanine carboxypeptidase